MTSIDEVMRALGDGDVLTPLDVQIARVLVRRSGEGGGKALATAIGAAFTSKACREGHSAITIARIVEQVHEARTELGGSAPSALSDEGETWWTSMLMDSACVSDGTTLTPLVLRDGMLQFWRYHAAEGRIARRVRELVATNGASPAFSIITGGPGTGKTTTAARVLVELAERTPHLRVALAAPTGKAAARLTESMRLRFDDINGDNGSRAYPAADARTLHRLLGYSQHKDAFANTAENPLGEDIVIVDEASMVDVLMMDALLRATKPGARLMLVGDHNQLASVDAGDVLGVLCRAARDEGAGSPLYESVTWLDKSWRFGQHPAIGELAKAILAGDADMVLKTCGGQSPSDVRLCPPPSDTDALLEPLRKHLDRCLGAASPAALLDALGTFRLLAPERKGRLGVDRINVAVERWLARQGHAVHERWYHGRPVLVTANDYSTGVFNGDLGVVWREGASASVHFPAGGGTTRALAPVKLPAVETAWAMTVHKAQGSEFDEVLVVLPEHESRILSRELLYTAVTRARNAVTIFSSEAAIRSAVGRAAERTSGLAALLRGDGAPA